MCLAAEEVVEMSSGTLRNESVVFSWYHVVFNVPQCDFRCTVHTT